MKRINYFAVICLAVTFLSANISSGQIFDNEPHERLSKISNSLRDSTRSDPDTYLPILTKELISGVTNEFEIVKLIHDWITTEISYDNEVYLRRTELIYKTNDVLRNSRAICVGYCNLFLKMCEYADIEAASIIGFAKGPNDNEKTLPEYFKGSTHSWSAAKIYGKWYLLDITWDAGYSLNKKYVFEYSTTYLFIDPELFIKNHFPEDIKWQLLDEPVSWSEFRELTFVEPVKKLSLNNSTIRGGISYSRLYNLSIPDITETKGFNLSFSLNKEITNELGLEGEFSFNHLNINQDLSSLLSSPNFNAEKSTYIDPLTQDPVTVGNYSFENIGVGANLKYHFPNKTSLIPFLKSGLSISLPFSFSSAQNGMIVRTNGNTEVVKVNEFNFLDQVLYGVLISTGVDFVTRETQKNKFQPLVGLELRWSFLLNSLKLFENYDEGPSNFKSFSINVMFYL